MNTVTVEASGQIDVRTSQALGISGRTEGGDQGRGNGQFDERQGQSEPNARQPSTSRQSGARGVDGRNDNAKRNNNSKSNEAQDKDRQRGDSRSSTSGQAGPADKDNDKDNAVQKKRPATSGQGTRSSEPGNTSGQSARPQNQAAPGGATKDQSKRRQ